MIKNKMLPSFIPIKLSYTVPEMHRPIAYFSHKNMLFEKKDHIIPKKICIDKSVFFEEGLDNYLNYQFPYAHTVFFHRCDKNFLFYNLRKDIFPNLERFYTNSHPCDFHVMHRFADKQNYVGYITLPFYQRFLHRWWNPDTRHIKKIEITDYEYLIKSYTKIDPTFEDNYV